jgi:fibrillarin-like rRNA methylase
MRRPKPFEHGGTPRLFERVWDDRTERWTETVGERPAVYGERWASVDGRRLRSFDPARSKLAAALAKGWTGALPAPGETWLYLGAASGTTASHVADLVGPNGAVFAVEKSPRPFARLVDVAARWPNLLPILDDAREPDRYADLVPEVDGIYADVAQPDQVGLLLRNAERFLTPGSGAFLLALKIPSLGRERAPTTHLHDAERRLGEIFLTDEPIRLEPFHRGHYLLSGRSSPAVARPAARPRTGPSNAGGYDRPRASRFRPAPGRGPPRGPRRR